MKGIISCGHLKMRFVEKKKSGKDNKTSPKTQNNPKQELKNINPKNENKHLDYFKPARQSKDNKEIPL